MRDGGTVLVTGAAGFCGRHLVEDLLAQGADVVALDLQRPRLDELNRSSDRVTLVPCDLAVAGPGALEAALGGRRFSAVYHLAGLASVRRSFSDIRQTLEVNALAALTLFGALQRQDPLPPLLLVGSAEEYGPGPAEGSAFAEGMPLEPVSPYALSKVWQESLGRYYARTRRWPVLMTRTFNHTGPGQGSDFVCADFARQIARIELGLQAPVLRVGNLGAARDFLDVRDVAAAYRLVLERGSAGTVYNVCSGKTRSIAELLRLLLGHAAVAIEVAEDTSRLRPIDIPVLRGDPGLLVRETGWSPRYGMEETLRDLLGYWRGRAAAEVGGGTGFGRERRDP
jgi:GDP-4-dehydro-6-deoxy-D-mannose reductase